MIEVKQLETFRTIVEVGSFTGAGERLGISRSAISQQIRVLEEEFACIPHQLAGSSRRFHETDPYAPEITPRAPITDGIECLFIGGGFSALLTSARLREIGVASIRVVERGADVGGTWYWNRYPGVACDVPSYDYLPLLDELDYVPKHRYARGDEIYRHCQAIARKYDLYELAVFQTTVTSTEWNEEERMWHVRTDRGDHMKARFVICANGFRFTRG